ncbi:MAG: T9SS type A sorting domain-containing protein [Bacteroidia bacterium]|nr:T9SS type A sorting domain-containing protein [Bacteroidia bacterium]
MKIKSTITNLIVAVALTLGYSASAQCTFSGLASSYCANSPASTLVPSASGGSFTGSSGLTGSVFSPSLAGPGTYTINYGICTASYVIETNATNSTVVFAPINTSTSSSEAGLTLTDDVLSSGIPIGFSFNFFCNTYTTAYVSSNGFISFNGSCGNGCCSGGSIPTNNSAVDDLIASSWTDLNPGAGGSITYATLGTAPNRTLFVSYNSVPFFSGSGSVTNQIKLMEGSNIIEIHTTSKPSSSSIVTMGIQNSGSTAGFPVAGRNASSAWTASNECIRFVPVLNCSVTQTTTVYPATLSVTGSTLLCSSTAATLTAGGNSTYTWTGGTSSNAGQVIVNPTSTTNYSVSATNSAGCISNAVVTVTVGVPALVISATNNSVCLGQSITLTASGATSYTWTGGITNGTAFAPLTSTNYVVSGNNACGTTTSNVNVTVTPIPISIVSTPASICAGNPATITASSAGTSYTWQPFSLPGASIVVSPTVTTVYTVSATNATCQGNQTFTLTASPVPTVTSASSNSNICAGVTVTLSASGGNNYTWTPGNATGSVITVSPTAPTLYSVVADNSAGCLGGSSQVIIVSPSPTLVVNGIDPIICNGGTTSLTATGADTYVWSSGGTSTLEIVSPTQLTTYTIVGTSTVNFCSTTSTINVDVFTPSVSIAGSTVICNGLSTSLTGSGATSYTWDPGSNPFAGITVNPNVTSTYTLSTLTQTGNLNCAAVNTVQVLVNPTPTVTAVSNRTAMCKGESVTLTAGGANTYSWSTTATTSSISITSTLITNLTYSVVGVNAQGCSSSATVTVRVNACNGISESNAQVAKLELYPNPNSGEFKISYNSAVNLSLVNELGQVVKTISLDETNNYTYSVTGLANGIYLINGETQGRKINQKIVVTH